MQQRDQVQSLTWENPGFETILALPLEAGPVAAEENYCPDCYDCDTNCEECQDAV